MATRKKTTRKATRKKPGRKPIVVDLARVEELASQGLTKGNVSAAMGIHSATWHRHQAENPEINAAYLRGKQVAIGTVENALYQNALSGNLGAQCFYLKNRAPETWRETRELKLEQAHRVEFDERRIRPVQEMTTAELNEQIDRLHLKMVAEGETMDAANFKCNGGPGIKYRNDQGH